MSHTLRQIKEHIRSRFLGRAGIHAVGLSLKQNVIRLYVDPKSHTERADTLAEVRESARPFGVEVIEEAPPGISPAKPE